MIGEYLQGPSGDRRNYVNTRSSINPFRHVIEHDAVVA